MEFDNADSAAAFAYGLKVAGADAYLSDYIVAEYAHGALGVDDRRIVEEILDSAHASN